MRLRKGAESVGNEVKELYLQGMSISGCFACEGCSRNGGQRVQKDDMALVNKAVEWYDVIVFESFMYLGTVISQLKTIMVNLLIC